MRVLSLIAAAQTGQLRPAATWMGARSNGPHSHRYALLSSRKGSPHQHEAIPSRAAYTENSSSFLTLSTTRDVLFLYSLNGACRISLEFEELCQVHACPRQ